MPTAAADADRAPAAATWDGSAAAGIRLLLGGTEARGTPTEITGLGGTEGADTSATDEGSVLAFGGGDDGREASGATKPPVVASAGEDDGREASGATKPPVVASAGEDDGRGVAVASAGEEDECATSGV